MTEVFTALTISLLFGIGIYMILRRDIMKIAVGFSLISHSINLTIVTSGIFTGTLVPILTETINEHASFIFTDDFSNGILAPIVSGFTENTSFVDPLTQALVLTAIVISFATTAILLTLAYRISEEYGTTDVDELRRLHG
ncbi:Na(+)/H(+) antiporter subunit C [Methanimicrococcus sp. At1]|uniref:Na(+)/H(+) antiporter subunit C n=1 Tax=Methanimicrococcus hacksteinii TaxID=3028293 RepID=A0ABU3VQS6_9EURY|nr:NADH-quinone oxidoreductase subunit K [Methanimicrococcus sp. At1]MDV0445767.1 Na(+)/H(+) antiporter subunit C [Methanimicrococcus sp. At1]